jgi:hypothetical protein|tara:strand:+ start:369 stop:551 length:183 start_codon:yes stop_codon:yes gene_type:complete
VLSTIDKIEKIRAENNRSWMDILRLASRVAPEEARKLLGEIVARDKEISALLEEGLADDV